MKLTFLGMIRCPVCGGKDFSCQAVSEDAYEIREGQVICNGCHKEFPIQAGILNLLIHPSDEIISEQQGWTTLEKAVKNTDELMLSLPDAGGEHSEAWTGQALNFHYVFSEIKLQGGEKVLDLGAGRCWASRYFARAGCDVVGIDILLTKYVGLLTGDVYIQNDKIFFERICGDMNQLPFQDGKFDIVFMAAALHHSSVIGAAIQEVSRVLKPGGRLVLVNEPVIDLFASKKLDCTEVSCGINEHVYRLLDYLSALARNGFGFRVIPFIGSYSRIITKVNHFMVSTFPKQLMPKNVWPPLLYTQLLLRGGVLNLIARKRNR